MFTLNKASFSGTVKGVTPIEKGASLVVIEQNAFGMFPTRYVLYVPQGLPVPSLADKVCVKDAISYEKKGERRFKIFDADQVTVGEAYLNEHSFTGMVKGWHQVGSSKNIKIEISQDVLGMIPTSFLLFLSEKQQRELSGPLMEIGDYVIITGASAYEKDGEWRYKVKRWSDTGILYFQDYEKGTKDAQFLKEVQNGL